MSRRWEGRARIKGPPMLGSGCINMNKTSFLFSMSSLASWVNRSKGGFLKEVRFGLCDLYIHSVAYTAHTKSVIGRST